MSILLDDFSGGLNERDSPNFLKLNETPAALNWTLDERGGGRLRKGCLNVVALPGDTGQVAAIFHSIAVNKWLCVRRSGADVHLFSRPSDFSGSWTDVANLATLSGTGWSALVTAFVDFPSTTPRVVLCGTTAGGTNGIVTYDGTTAASATSVDVHGTALALWQNRAWCLGSSDITQQARLWYSNIGDATQWSDTAQFVDIREKDATRLRALGVAGGALIVFKQRSAFRVNDSNTGAFSMIDPARGCLDPKSLVALKGRLYTWGIDGLYEWDGIGPARNVGDKAGVGLYSSVAAVLGESLTPSAIAGALPDSVLFAYPSTTLGQNDRLLEYNPTHGWLAKHQLPNTAQNEITHFAMKGTEMFAAIQDGDAIFKMFTETPGSDAGTLYTGSYRTPWLQPSRGRLARILRAQIEGLLKTGGTNTLTVRVYKDWDLSAFDSYDVSTDLRGGDANDQQETTILRSLGHSRAFALEFVTGTAAGDAAVRSLDLETVALER